MLKKNVISPSKSPWVSSIVLVKKKDGTSRFCVDYRQVNAVTRKDAYPLPKPEDREKTAFITSEDLYEFNVLPFGLRM